MLDLVTVAGASLCAVRLDGSIDLMEWMRTPSFLATPFFFWVALYSLGVYRSFRLSGLMEEMWLLAQGVILGVAVLLVFGWFTRQPQPSRARLMVFLALSFLWLCAGRILLRSLLRVARSRGYNVRYFVIVGSGPRAQAIAEEMVAQSYWGVRVLGHVTPPAEGRPFIAPRKWLGTLPELESVLKSYIVDGVFFVVEELSPPTLHKALECCRRLGIEALVDLHPFEEMRSRLKLSELAHSPLLIIGQTPLEGAHAFLKRTFDLVTAAVALVVGAPLMLGIAALAKISSPGPVLFRQQRVGLHGRLFNMLKFRTMIVGAEGLRETVAGQNEMDGPVFKMRHDPRITRIGHYLRRSSLDELPQLWNVLCGDMSLVGPRPPLLREVRQYQSWQRRRLSVRPGLTCLWQVSGRNDVSFENWMKLDLEYIDNWSWWLDLKILLRTLPAMVRGQ